MRSDRDLLDDIREAIEIVQRHTPAQRSVLDNDPLLQSHLFRHVQIIGEAAWRISGDLKQAHPEVPWQRIAAMRHVLVHDYFDIDLDQVWDVVTTHIPALQPQMQALNATLPPETEEAD